MADRLTRIAIVSSDRCKPKKCRQECKKSCPVVKTDYQSSKRLRERYNTSLWAKHFQVAQAPSSKAGAGAGVGWNKWYWKINRSENLGWKRKPNLGRFTTPLDWQEILTHFRGSELQNYFTRILEDNLKAIMKPQYADHIPKAVRGNVGEVLDQKNERDMKAELCADLELNQVIDRDVENLLAGFVPTENLRYL